jgi:hypothetical protein
MQSIKLKLKLTGFLILWNEISLYDFIKELVFSLFGKGFGDSPVGMFGNCGGDRCERWGGFGLRKVLESSRNKVKSQCRLHPKQLSLNQIFVNFKSDPQTQLELLSKTSSPPATQKQFPTGLFSRELVFSILI